MSLAFSDTTNKSGIIQLLERILFGENGDGRISDNATLLAMFTSDINLALDNALALIFNADGTWQFDDSNHTDYPIITTNLVASQRDYPFTTDEQSNLILEVQKVLVDSGDGTYREIEALDAQSERNTAGFWDGNDTTGAPIKYDKTANGIFLDPIPNANVTNGLKIYISREGSYFSVSDTSKKPGIPGLFHEYLAINPAYKYAYRNGLSNMNFLRQEKLELEESMVQYFNRRENDVVKRFKLSNDSNK